MGWAMVLVLIAILSGIFIGGGVFAGAARLAQILFVVFLALLVMGLVASGFRRSSSHRTS